jgi:hypothetical protein
MLENLRMVINLPGSDSIHEEQAAVDLPRSVASCEKSLAQEKARLRPSEQPFWAKQEDDLMTRIHSNA